MRGQLNKHCTKKMKNLSISARKFLKFSFKGNGKYYITEQGSKAYKKTDFYNVFNKNKDSINVLNTGNDAPRGGKTGDYLIVEFTNKFYEKYQFYLDYLKKEFERKLEEEKKESEIDLQIKLAIQNHQEKINSWLEKYGTTSKGGRTVAWKCQKLSGFENFSTSQIYRNI